MRKILLTLGLLTAITLTPTQAFAVTGWASFYTCCKLTANGERFNKMGLTAAHRSYKFGTRLKVTSLKTGKSVVVRVNDRGPFVKGRIIDLSLGAARVIGLNKSGVAKVKVTVLK
jgi:rare lipoprotein A